MLAVWTAVSIRWSPVPSGARDEALLTLLYALAFALPLVTLRTSTDRLAATGLVVAELVVLGGMTAWHLAVASAPFAAYFGGRLDFPVSYVNACSALFTSGVWPAVVLATSRRLPAPLRVAAVAGVSILAALAISAQSKGTVVGVTVSTVIVMALAPNRLRLLPPLVAGLVPAAIAVAPLTAPFRSGSAAAGHRPGWAALAVLGAGVVLGAAYVFLDRRVHLSVRATAMIGRAIGAALVLACMAGVAAFFVTVSSPARFVGKEWHAFKHVGQARDTSTHLVSLGSNRYDFWRVAIETAEAHPLEGTGGRGFFVAYLQNRRSAETPLRAHSVYLDALAEEGIPGLALLLVGVGGALTLAGRLRRRPSALGALGAGTYFFVHAGVDWIWTIPVVGFPVFLLLGIGCSGTRQRLLSPGVSRVAGAVALVVALLAFAPPWIAHRYVAAALKATDPGPDLRRARFLDPLSTDPYWAQWQRATSPSGRVAALRGAERIEPTSVAVLYQLGLSLVAAGNRRAALAALRSAETLDPRDANIRMAIRQASS